MNFSDFMILKVLPSKSLQDNFTSKLTVFFYLGAKKKETIKIDALKMLL